MVQLLKVDPNESGSLAHFSFVRWYLDDEVSLNFTKEAELLVFWGSKVTMMDIW